MAGTILPIVHGKRNRKAWSSLWWHAIGGLLGGGGLGFLVGCPLWAANWPGSRWSPAIAAAGAVSLLWSCREMGALHLPTPQSTWQVPASWRRDMPTPIACLVYGMAMGCGVLVRIRFASFYVALVWAFFSGPLPGAAVLGVFGASRALPLFWLATRFGPDGEAFDLLRSLGWWQSAGRAVNGLAMCFTGAFLLTVGWGG